MKTTSNIHHTASDYLRWDTMLNIVRKLYRDGNYIMSLYIGCGAFFGLRVSDTKRLTWRMLLENDTFTIIEQKTKKHEQSKSMLTFKNTSESVLTLLERIIWMICVLYHRSIQYTLHSV